MDKNFYSFWFKGMDNALSKLDDNSLDTLFSECGKPCSESHTKKWYIDEYSASEDFDDFLHRLDIKYKDMHVKRLTKNTVEVKYTHCACNLVEDHLIKNPKLCLCSLKSLIINWEAILGKSNIKAEIDTTIL